MASTTTPVNPQISPDRVNQPTLLSIPAELRNIVYDNVFSSESKHGIVPHPLTRVSQSIRRESLAMYYASIKHKTLEILLHNPKQFANAKQWLTEVDTKLYPVLPDIEISWTEYKPLSSCKFALRCARQVTKLGVEFDRQLDSCLEAGVRRSRIFEEAMQETSDYCLGLSKLEGWVSRLTEEFESIVCKILTEESEERAWSVRHLSVLPGRWQQPCISMFEDLALRKNGYEWEMCDLRYIIESLEDVAAKPPHWQR